MHKVIFALLACVSLVGCKSHSTSADAGGGKKVRIHLGALKNANISASREVSRFDNPAENCKQQCRYVGKCSKDGEACYASSQEDCSKCLGCRLNGLCTLRARYCVAATDEDCRNSQFCGQAGMCKAVAGRCIADSDEDCRRSQLCAQHDKCHVVDGHCVDGKSAAASSSSGKKASPSNSSSPASKTHK